MRRANGWTNRNDYAAFLSVQYGARQPVEAWLCAHAPTELQPPEQCPHIARDLDSLGAALPFIRTDFALAPDGDAQALGAAWVLAGSALGNRSILKDIRRSGHADWPVSFLANETMLAFWSDLRARIEQPVDHEILQSATAGANAVFDHFIAYAEQADQGEHTLQSSKAA